MLVTSPAGDRAAVAGAELGDGGAAHAGEVDVAGGVIAVELMAAGTVVVVDNLAGAIDDRRRGRSPAVEPVGQVDDLFV